ncbi:hypothetical protein LTR84_004665 [Exophiala bonariae]|uniref:Amine oxidase n=1 Tax=Exophiala bonariae TaxID=1690606 RepID=A0AAV9NRF0_9EURO|nr:hypothetical protein LTR84_004665 [Exophiala bonariae]
MAAVSQSGVFDIVVVGAGLSGLPAAHLLQKLGLSTIVLEACNRVGGKTLTTDRVDGITIRQEYGTAWFNDTTQSHIWALARKLGIQGLVQNSEVPNTFARSDTTELTKYSSEFDTNQRIAIRDLIEKVTTDPGGPLQSPSQRKELDTQTFEGYLYRNVNGSTRAYATAKVWSQTLIGCDPGEVSALFILDYIRVGGGLMQMRRDKRGDGQYMRIKDGVSAFPEPLVQRLVPGILKLKSPVTSVTELNDSGCSLVNTSGTEAGDHEYFNSCLSNYTFSPRLSAAKRAYVDGTRYPHYIKYLVVFNKPFWRDNGYCGLSMSLTGAACVFRDASIEEGDGQSYRFTAFIAGFSARAWSFLPRSEKQSSVLKQLSQMFNGGKDVTPWFIEALESRWMTEQYFWLGLPYPYTTTRSFQ